MTKYNLDQVALDAAYLIEDMFAQSWVGGIAQRRAAIQIQIRSAMNIAVAQVSNNDKAQSER